MLYKTFYLKRKRKATISDKDIGGENWAPPFDPFGNVKLKLPNIQI